ncbi:hypothetical protein NKG05_14235 [Oerskovia sp. M15]
MTAAADETPAPSGLTAEEAATLHSLMRSVVTDGSAVLLADLPGTSPPRPAPPSTATAARRTRG